MAMESILSPKQIVVVDCQLPTWQRLRALAKFLSASPKASTPRLAMMSVTSVTFPLMLQTLNETIVKVLVTAGSPGFGLGYPSPYSTRVHLTKKRFKVGV